MAKKKTTTRKKSSSKKKGASKKAVTKKSSKKKAAAKPAGKKSSKKKSTTKKSTTRKKPATKKKSTKKAVGTKKKSTKKKSTKQKSSTKATSSKTKSTKKKSTRKSTSKKAAASTGSEGTAADPPKKVFRLVQPGSNGARKGRAGTTRPTLRYRPTITGDETREPPTVAELKKVKNGLSRKEMQHYKQLLLERRADILGDVDAMRNESLKDVEKEISYDHMADGGSDSFEQEFTLGLVESERRMLEKIDDALLRMKDRYYGVCVETAKPIGKARLEAKPWARYCIEVAREKERRGEI